MLPQGSKGGTPGKQFPGGHRRGVTPVPIPNTEVKLSTADGTARVTAWESRSLPGLFLTRPDAKASGLFFLVPVFLTEGHLRFPCSDTVNERR